MFTFNRAEPSASVNIPATDAGGEKRKGWGGYTEPEAISFDAAIMTETSTIFISPE
jgi:hypothetical protein